MKQELSNALEEDFPELYSSPTFQGFQIGDGWEPIIRDLSMQIIAIRRKLSLDELESVGSAFQVKEKFGGLRFYMSGGETQEMIREIEIAEEKALRTCEFCGTTSMVSLGSKPGGHWIKTLCGACRKNWNYER